MYNQPNTADFPKLDPPHGLPLHALLSQVLVAFTIEFDNEFEYQVPHRTTNHGSTSGSPHLPWLVSRAMWSNVLQFVDADGTTIRDLRSRLQMPGKDIRIWLTRLADWWGYLVIDAKAGGVGPRRMHPDAVVLPAPGGRKAFQVWPTLDGLVEARWRARFGEETIDLLRHALSVIVGQIDPSLPESLPVLGYGLFSKPFDHKQPVGTAKAVANPARLSLPSLLSRALLGFAIEFEQTSDVSLAISANVLRLPTDEGVPLSELPRMAAVSKEAIAISLSFLVKQGFAEMQSKPGGHRGKVVFLTPKGSHAQKAYRQLVAKIEQQWWTVYGEEAVARLRESLAKLAGDPAAPPSPLLCCLQPYPNGWRASLPKPEALPHYPVVLHRGGFPDGA